MPESKRTQMRARIAGLDTKYLLEGYEISARAFALNPQGADADAHILILGMMDMELLEREIPCCAECSVPTSIGFHVKALHTDGTLAGDLADALTDAAMDSARRIAEGS